jgi:hypothetical protein
MFTIARKFLVGMMVPTLMVAITSTARSATNYGDFVGPNISYLHVTEDPTKFPGPVPIELRGSPVLNANTLIFTPDGFSASSMNGNFAFTNSNLNIAVQSSIPQQVITQLTLTQMGAYSLIGGTATGTRAGVSIDAIQAQVMAINGAPVEPMMLPKTISYVNGGTATATTSFGGMQFASAGGQTINQPWSASVGFVVPPGATMIELVVGDSLFSTSQDGSNSFIDVKSFQVNPSFAVVPEPATVITCAFGMLMLISMRPAFESRLSGRN